MTREHVNEGNYSTKFTLKDLQEIFKAIAFAMQIGVIPFTKKNYPNTPQYPKVRRLLEADPDELYFHDCEDEQTQLIELEDKV